MLDVHAPHKILTKRQVAKLNKPWITQGILNSIKIKDKLHRKYIKAKDQNVKNNCFLKFKSYRNKIANLLKISKKNHYNDYFNDNLNNIKNTWKGINEIINVKKTKKNSPSSLNINNEIITDNTVIANTFNSYFSNIADKLSKKIKPSKNHYTDYLTNPNLNSFFLRPVSVDEVSRQINSLKNGKSQGPNSLPTSHLKMVHNTIAKPLSNIINNSFKYGIFPDLFKIAKVIPVYKNGSKLDCSNYRPISLLSNISKLFEKTMHSRLYDFLNKCGFLYKNQFGFRKKHSTTHALIEITENIRKALDENHFPCGVFVDLQKAFDTVNHEILIDKLSYYGVRGLELGWFKYHISLIDLNMCLSIIQTL